MGRTTMKYDAIDKLLIILGIVATAVFIGLAVTVFVRSFDIRDYEYEDFNGEIKHSKVCYRSGSYLYCHGEDKQPIKVVRFKAVEE